MLKRRILNKSTTFAPLRKLSKRNEQRSSGSATPPLGSPFRELFVGCSFPDQPAGRGCGGGVPLARRPRLQRPARPPRSEKLRPWPPWKGAWPASRGQSEQRETHSRELLEASQLGAALGLSCLGRLRLLRALLLLDAARVVRSLVERLLEVGVLDREER